ncbi:MAG: hypothetical protein GC204_05105 [Chloroflexi bacterium]|nr:hypothetical protein [Chloroflexota bacterium]
MRACDIFMERQGVFLGEHGFISDPGQVERTASGAIVVYHYTRTERLQQIFAEGSGLWARLPIVSTEFRPEFEGYHLVEALLEPLPRWITNSPYFGDFGLELMRGYVGNILLRIEVPMDFPGLYIVDAAHNFECKHVINRGKPVLNLGYDCRTGHEVCRAEINSYMPLTQYQGGYVAPNVRIIRYGQGIAIPKQYVSICAVQPLKPSLREGQFRA